MSYRAETEPRLLYQTTPQGSSLAQAFGQLPAQYQQSFGTAQASGMENANKLIGNIGSTLQTNLKYDVEMQQKVFDQLATAIREGNVPAVRSIATMIGATFGDKVAEQYIDAAQSGQSKPDTTEQAKGDLANQVMKPEQGLIGEPQTVSPARTQTGTTVRTPSEKALTEQKTYEEKHPRKGGGGADEEFQMLKQIQGQINNSLAKIDKLDFNRYVLLRSQNEAEAEKYLQGVAGITGDELQALYGNLINYKQITTRHPNWSDPITYETKRQQLERAFRTGKTTTGEESTTEMYQY
jgi:hypothetical protein